MKAKAQEDKSLSGVINNVARYMIASLFYFELESVLQRSEGKYIGRGHLFCSIRRNDPAFQLLFDRLSRNSAQFWINGCPVIDVDDSCFDSGGNFRKQVELNTDNRFAIGLKQDSSEFCNISGSPFSITRLILLQGFCAVFGRLDHRKRRSSGRWTADRWARGVSYGRGHYQHVRISFSAEPGLSWPEQKQRGVT